MKLGNGDIKLWSKLTKDEALVLEAPGTGSFRVYGPNNGKNVTPTLEGIEPSLSMNDIVIVAWQRNTHKNGNVYTFQYMQNLTTVTPVVFNFNTAFTQPYFVNRTETSHGNASGGMQGTVVFSSDVYRGEVPLYNIEVIHNITAFSSTAGGFALKFQGNPNMTFAYNPAAAGPNKTIPLLDQLYDPTAPNYDVGMGAITTNGSGVNVNYRASDTPSIKPPTGTGSTVTDVGYKLEASTWISVKYNDAIGSIYTLAKLNWEMHISATSTMGIPPANINNSIARNIGATSIPNHSVPQTLSTIFNDAVRLI